MMFSIPNGYVYMHNMHWYVRLPYIHSGKLHVSCVVVEVEMVSLSGAFLEYHPVESENKSQHVQPAAQPMIAIEPVLEPTEPMIEATNAEALVIPKPVAPKQNIQQRSISQDASVIVEIENYPISHLHPSIFKSRVLPRC